MSFYWKSGQIVEGKTASQIARETGRSEDAVRSAARRMGVSLPPKPRGYPSTTKSRALRLVESGMSQAKVSEATGVSLRQVHSLVKSKNSDGSP